MTNFEFRDSLTIDPFTNWNGYIYSELRQSNLRINNESENIPYIIKGSSQTGPGNSMKGTIYLCEHRSQFKSRLLNTKKIKDIMDSARYALNIQLKENWYYIGKGYLALKLGVDEPKLLFVACYNGKSKRQEKIEDIKFFVCRDIFNEEHKVIQPAIKDFINNHTGDVIITNDITNYVGEYIRIPPGMPLAKEKEYKAAVVIECINDVLTKST